MTNLVKMQNDAGKTADVHPDMVADYVAGGYRKIAGAKPAITRESIEKMKKKEVVELLEAHGVSDASGSVGELREKLTEIMFVGD
jgi:hypothetical protein